MRRPPRLYQNGQARDPLWPPKRNRPGDGCPKRLNTAPDAASFIQPHRREPSPGGVRCVAPELCTNHSNTDRMLREMLIRRFRAVFLL